MTVAQKYQDKLGMYKGCVEDFHTYFKDNIRRYEEMMKFTFDTTLSDQDLVSLQVLKKPAIECNVLEAYCNRLIGEFSEKEPSYHIRAAAGIAHSKLTPEFLKTIEVIESHIREMLSPANNDSLLYNTWRQTIGGGYSALRVRTDYLSEMSFDQKIIVEAVFDPTLCGWDPMARESTMADGSYCFSITPMTREDFISQFGEDAAKDINYVRNEDGFSWYYETEEKEILLVVDFFVKEKKEETIVELSNGHTILYKHYDMFEEMWKRSKFIEQMPQILRKRRTVIEVIHQYVFCGNRILHHSETDFKYLPIVFIDGNSQHIKKTRSGPTKLMTKPYVLQARGAQRLKNYAMQTMGGELEDMIQHKFVVAEEAIPEKYKDAYTNVQNAAVLIYKLFDEMNPGVQLPAPTTVNRVPTPPIVGESFGAMDQTIQMILGSYDAQMGIVGDNISGKAIQLGAMHSSASAQPYYMGMIRGLNQVGKIILDLIPKYYITPRSIPVRYPDGKRSYQIINQPLMKPEMGEDGQPVMGENGQPKMKDESIYFNYDPMDLELHIEAGVNTAQQKQQTLETLIKMSAASEIFGKFINTYGLPILVENLDVRGGDMLKEAAEQFMQEERQAQMAKAQEKDPMTLAAEAEIAKAQAEQASVEQRREEAQGNLAIKSAQVSVEKQNADINAIKMMAEIEDKQVGRAIEQEKASSEDAQRALENIIDLAVMKNDMGEPANKEE